MGIFSNINTNPQNLEEAEKNQRILTKNVIGIQNRNQKKEIKKKFGK